MGQKLQSGVFLGRDEEAIRSEGRCWMGRRDRGVSSQREHVLVALFILGDPAWPPSFVLNVICFVDCNAIMKP